MSHEPNDLLRTFEIDLAEAPSMLREKVKKEEAAEEKLLERVDERYGSFSKAPEEQEATFRDEFHTIREARAKYEERARRIESFIEEHGWDSWVFVFDELSTEDSLYVEGRTSAMADQARKSGTRIDPGAFGVGEMLDRCCVRKPDGAPGSLKKLPGAVGNWLLDRLNELSTEGVSEELGNSSPEEALARLKSSRQSSSGGEST